MPDTKYMASKVYKKTTGSGECPRNGDVEEVRTEIYMTAASLRK